MLREMMKNPKNMRPNPELPWIVETDANNKEVGASVIQEIPNEDGTKEKVFSYTTRATCCRLCCSQIPEVLDWKGFPDSY